jgi:Protein of unknown function (DUF4058)
MPSPFPGMDPYLEDPDHSPDLHTRLINGIGDALSPLIRPRYVARLETRTYFPDPDDPAVTLFIPDVRLEFTRRRASKSAGNVAVLTPPITKPIETITMLDGEFRESRVEIVEVSNRQVVAVIELLSPSNKVGNSASQRSFHAKRQEIMNSPAHWVEIDLLRGNTSLDPLVMNRFQPHDYYMHVSNADMRPRGSVWLVQLQDRLPTIGIPLRKPDADVGLDLQSVLNTAYERAAYDLTVNYTKPPVPPLTKPQAKWAKKLTANRK